MEHRLCLLATLTLILSIHFTIPLVAQTSYDLTGSLQTDNRVRYDDGSLTWNENRLNLELSGGNMVDYGFYSEVRLRAFGLPEVSELADLQRRDKEEVIPWGLEFREGYLDLYAIGMPSLDVRIGRQIINWGTGDGFNPTGNVSPDDLEDFLFFGSHLGVNALKATYYAPAFRMTGVFVPAFTPATLPPGEFSDAFFTSGIDTGGGSNFQLQTDLRLPENTIGSSSQYAFKVATLVFNFDVSLSYYNGRYDLPVISEVVFSDPNTVNAALRYPRMQVIGGDFAGAIGEAGIWGEAAYYLPEAVTGQITVPSLVSPDQTVTMDSTMLSDSPYTQYLLGADYTFQNRWYVNLQYLHGFLHERGFGNLNDYLVFRSERDFFNGKLTISPLSFAVVITDWSDPFENYGVVGIPELTWHPYDNVEILLGSFLFEGSGENLFQSIERLDELYFRVTVSF